MSSLRCIPIPARKKKKQVGGESSFRDQFGSSVGSSTTFQYGSSASSAGSVPIAGEASKVRGGERTSLMSPAFAKAEHTVVNVGDDESPRLITCVKTSQGFDWNQQIFLPSYAGIHFEDLEHKQDPVQDIVVTDEEIKNMFPT